MFNKSLILVSLFAMSFAYAKSTDLSKVDFQKSQIFYHVVVDKAELVFSDDQQQKDLYKVSYSDEGQCAPGVGGDNCEWVSYCEYVWAYPVGINNEIFIEGTHVSCDVEIEELIQPQLKED